MTQTGTKENKKETKRYEPPNLILLGEIDQGVGLMCNPGILVTVVDCGPGSNIIGACIGGTSASGACTGGGGNLAY